MHFALALYRLSQSGRVRRALGTLALETRTLLGALLSPGALIAEVKAMRAMQLEAARIETTQPARAAVLRHQGFQIVFELCECLKFFPRRHAAFAYLTYDDIGADKFLGKRVNLLVNSMIIEEKCGATIYGGRVEMPFVTHVDSVKACPVRAMRNWVSGT